MHSIHCQIYKQVHRTYVDALVTASFLMPNFRGSLTMMALPLVFPASCTLELLAGRVVTIPFDGSVVVEGTVWPITTSSPDVVVRGTLAAGLEEEKVFKKTQIDRTRPSTRLRSISYSPVAGSLWGAATLPHRRPCSLWRTRLGIRAWSGAMLPITLLPSCLFICITKARY